MTSLYKLKWKVDKVYDLCLDLYCFVQMISKFEHWLTSLRGGRPHLHLYNPIVKQFVKKLYARCLQLVIAIF